MEKTKKILIVEDNRNIANLVRVAASREGYAVEIALDGNALLVLLASQPGVVLSRERVLQDVWGHAFEGYGRSVDSQITRLRRKIESDPRDPKIIETVWGVGYRFQPPASRKVSDA